MGALFSFLLLRDFGGETEVHHEHEGLVVRALNAELTTHLDEVIHELNFCVEDGDGGQTYKSVTGSTSWDSSMSSTVIVGSSSNTARM